MRRPCSSSRSRAASTRRCAGERPKTTWSSSRARGTVVVVGMPGEQKVDWAPIWQRELTVTGAYAYGTEPKRKGRKTFELALEAAPEMHLDELTGPLFGLGEYRDAIAYAMSAGRLGAVKVAFDLRRLRA